MSKDSKLSEKMRALAESRISNVTENERKIVKMHEVINSGLDVSLS